MSKSWAVITRHNSLSHFEGSTHCVVLFDMGANICVTNHCEYFTVIFNACDGNELIDGTGKGPTFKGEGNVAWIFETDDGSYAK